MTRLDEIKARAEAGTSGLWVNPHGAMEKYGYEFINSPSGIVASKIDNHANAEFIAHARTDVPVLVAAVEAVLELHKPITDDGNSLRNWLGVYDGKPRDYCNECEVDGYTAVPYPCPTVTAIQSALGESSVN
jgi:hypothetical protein